jgi:predicted DNA repair protein MutK
VAAIVKLDDAGMLLLRDGSAHIAARLKRGIGNGLLWIAPRLMKALSVLGTAAMFLVGGGILVHGMPLLSGWLHGAGQAAAGVPGVGAVLAGLTPALLNGGAGIVAGAIVLAAVSGYGALARRLRGA